MELGTQVRAPINVRFHEWRFRTGLWLLLKIDQSSKRAYMFVFTGVLHSGIIMANYKLACFKQMSQEANGLRAEAKSKLEKFIYDESECLTRLCDMDESRRKTFLAECLSLQKIMARQDEYIKEYNSEIERIQKQINKMNDMKGCAVNENYRREAINHAFGIFNRQELAVTDTECGDVDSDDDNDILLFSSCLHAPENFKHDTHLVWIEQEYEKQRVQQAHDAVAMMPDRASQNT